MSQVGVLCPIYGKKSHEECRECSRNPETYNCMIPLPILNMMRREEDEERIGIYSPTQLTDCRRKAALLQDDKPYWFEPAKEWRKTKGTLIHSGLSEQGYPDALWTIKEQRLYMDIETKGGIVRFGGKPDLVTVDRIEVLNDGYVIHTTLIDWKYSEVLEHEPKIKDDHWLQLRMYKYLLEHEPEDRYGDLIFDAPVVVDEMTVFQFGNRFKRWSDKRNYEVAGKKSSQGYEALTLEKIGEISDEEIHSWIVEQIEHRQDDDATEKLPDILGPKDDWKCASCPVYHECRKLLR